MSHHIFAEVFEFRKRAASFVAQVESTPDSKEPVPLVFPAESKEKQKIAEKARKKAGIEKRKRKFIIEAVYDDYGTDLSGLGSDVVSLIAD